MTDFITPRQFNHINEQLNNNTSNNIDMAVQALLPYKDTLTREQFRHLVLYILLQRTNK